MKVDTKAMAFTDITATAPDKITGDKNIVAFRSYGLKNNPARHFLSEPGSFSLHKISKNSNLNITINDIQYF